ncbi:MAG TPA: polyprenyl synthetase family protein [Polyangiales bacterium]|nr:polyprenyl synthetase family protein [Polyangiales bacterium]
MTASSNTPGRRADQAQSPSLAEELVALLDRSVAQRSRDPLLAAVPLALWNEALFAPLREFLARPSKGFRARLVELGYRLAGGEGAAPRELAAIVEGLHAGSLIVDDIEDESKLRRDAPCLHRSIGLPLALNAGNFLYFWPQVLLAHSPLDAALRLRAHERTAHCLMRCHQGQALDLSVRVDELARADVPPVAMAIASLKTGGLLGLAMALGALAAHADEARVEALASFGCAIGVGLQMLDDMSGIQNPRRRSKALEDLHHARATFVWAWLAEALDDAHYEQLRRELAARRELGVTEALIERLRFRLGVFGTRHVRAHFQRALAELSATIGDHALFAEFEQELLMLERSYVEA